MRNINLLKMIIHEGVTIHTNFVPTVLLKILVIKTKKLLFCWQVGSSELFTW